MFYVSFLLNEGFPERVNVLIEADSLFRKSLQKMSELGVSFSLFHEAPRKFPEFIQKAREHVNNKFTEARKEAEKKEKEKQPSPPQPSPAQPPAKWGRGNGKYYNTRRPNHGQGPNLFSPTANRVSMQVCATKTLCITTIVRVHPPGRSTNFPPNIKCWPSRPHIQIIPRLLSMSIVDKITSHTTTTFRACPGRVA